MEPAYDVLGIGLNATDTLLIISHFPPYGGKVPFHEEILSPGGQVASAMVTCARLGLKTKYVGTVGDDERGRVQMDSLRGSGVNLDHVHVRSNCANQSAYIIIDQSTGERTVFWQRPECLALQPGDVPDHEIQRSRMLHIDGHDTRAVAHAAQVARAHRIPVTVDVDTIYPGFEEVLKNVDYLIASSEFPGRWTKIDDPRRALMALQSEFGMHCAAMTLGAHGALALVDGTFHYSPAFVVNCLDTTGAGDVFHGAFCYAVLQEMPIGEALDFANAMAALNCTAIGARGAIRGVPDARGLMAKAERRVHPEFVKR